MKKETILITLTATACASGMFALYIDGAYALPFLCFAVLFAFIVSLCEGDKTITLPTQCLDEACKMMEHEKGQWHLVAVAGHCVVAYRSKQKALDAMGRDGVGYALVGGA